MYWMFWFTGLQMLRALVCVGQAAQRVNLAREGLLAHPHQDQDRGQTREREHVPIDRRFHAGSHPAAIANRKNGLRMLGVPPLDRLIRNVSVDAAEDADYGPESGSLIGLLHRAAQQQVSGEDQP